MSRDDSTLNRRSFLTAAGGAAATVALAGCTGDDDEDQTPLDDGDGGDGDGAGDDTSDDGGDGNLLRYARGNDSSTLDPQTTTSGEDAKVTNQIYDKLIHFEPGESALTEGLAEDFELDGETATLTLREDAAFHNGDEFTAQDFIATYRRFVDEDYEHFIGNDQSIYGPYLLGEVEEIEAVDDHELEFTLSKPYAPFLANLAVFALAVLPESEITGDHDFGEEPVGTGPWEFEQWDTGNERIRLSANDDYWGEAPQVDELVFEAIGQNSTRAQALDAGEADVIDGIGAQQVEQIEDSDNAEVVREPGMTIGYMAFNMERVEEFRDRRVRQAISHAINTGAIVENIYRGLAVQASHPLPPNVMGHNEDLDPYEYDPERAQELLEEAGVEDLSFELATMNNPRPYFASPVQTAETVRSNLQEIGVEVTIDEQTWEPYLDYTSEGKHDACFLGWITDNADPDNFYSPLLHPGVDVDQVPDGQDWVERDVEGYNTGNRAAWANTEFMELVEEGQASYDDDEREDIYLEVSEIVHEEAPWVFMTHTEELRGVGNNVNDFTVAPIGGPFLNLVSLE